MTRVFPIRVPGDPTANPSLAADSLYALTQFGWSIQPSLQTAASDIVLFGSKSNLRRIDAVEASLSRLAVRLTSTSANDTDSLFSSLTAFRARGLSDARSIAFTGDVSGTLVADFTTSASIALSMPNVVAAGTYSQVVVDAKGRVTAGTLAASPPIAGGTLNGSLVITGDLTISSLNGSVIGGLRNHVTNGCFRVNGRNAVVVTGGADFPCDRFRTSAVGGSRTVQRVALTDEDRTEMGVADVLYAIQYAVTSGTLADDFAMLTHGIEGVRTLAGRTATLSFYARRASGTGDVATELVQEMGTGGTPSTAVTGIGAFRHASLTATWQRFTRTISIPAITGATLGSNRDDRLRINFWLSAGASFNARTSSLGLQTVTVQIAMVQLETGAMATPFDMRAFAFEQHACERFFQRRQVFFGGPFSSTPSMAPVTATTQMRTVPTVTIIPNDRINVSTATVVTASIYGAAIEYTADPTAQTYYAAFDLVDLSSDY